MTTEVANPARPARLAHLSSTLKRWPQVLARLHWGYAIEWALIIVIAYFYAGNALLDFDPNQLQQTGEQNESASLPILTDRSLRVYGEIPMWDPYMLTGLPHLGDPVNHFWNPISTLSILIWGAINGIKVSIFISLVLAGIGQWVFAHVFGARGLPRLWAGVLFMVSGGVAMFWRAGLYELLIGLAWFPWCFAALWWALPKRDYTSLILTALCVAVLLSAGGGYYPFYLFGSLAVLTLMALVWSEAKNRWVILGRAVIVAILSTGLLAIMWVPIIEGRAYLFRKVWDPDQRYSQPIPYALINYVVSTPAWFYTEILGTGAIWNWFYIGWLPLAALSLAVVSFVRVRRNRPVLTTLGVLTLGLLAWHANRYTPVKYIYDLIPFLYNLRFPNRLLVLAASPLIVLSALGLQYLFGALGRWARTLTAGVRGQKFITGARLRTVLYGLLAIGLLGSIGDVYAVNKTFGMRPGTLNPQATRMLGWLRRYDPGLYYINLNFSSILWNWTPIAYQLEMPVINFDYVRSLATQDSQHNASAPFSAMPKYLVTRSIPSMGRTAQLLQTDGEFQLWYLPEALPFVFGARTQDIQPYQKLILGQVTPFTASYNGPNRIVVEAEAAPGPDQLVVLVSNYPGWRVFVDGQPAELVPANDYLGAHLLPGKHTYTFVFQPLSFSIGLLITLLTLVLVDWLLWLDIRRARK